MRRARHRLKVSTFPFLAVLLCAMGALILFLVVLDRRAKIAARNKAVERSTELSREREQQIARRWEEWERQRQALQARLERQQHDLIETRQTVLREESAAAKQLAQEQALRQETQKKLEIEAAKLKEAERALAEKQAQVEVVTQQAPQARNEIVQLGFEVKELEDTLVKMKEAMKAADNTYSLVPYKGSQGEGRKPIYIEVAGDGLMFHPDRKTFAAFELETDAVRHEVAARLAGIDPQSSGKPYVFFIVRPTGIEHYYKAQAAMRRFDIDFGYEFVDADWQIDFGAKNVAEQFARQTRPGPELGGLPPIDVPGVIKTPPPAARSEVDLPPAGTSGGPVAAPSPKRGVPSIGFLGRPSDLVPELKTRPAVPARTTSVRRPTGAPSTPGFVPANRPQAVATGPASPPPSSEAMPALDITVPPAAVTQPGTPVEPAPPMGSPLQSEKGSTSYTTPPMSPGGEAAKPKAAPPVSRILGNRDFIVTIECTAEQVVVSPRGRVFPAKSLEQKATRDNPLAREVRDLIAQRQATVREGEPAYRPEIRFRIHPEGRRIFYLAYPMVEEIGVPMTREDAE